ncbi:hypothetical protein BH10BAC2_BH10BAC2_25280 [soil metagenome]
MLLSVLLLSATYIYNETAQNNLNKARALQTLSAKKMLAFGCSPNLAAIDFTDTSNVIPLLDGWGDYRMPVTVTNDSAKIYFEQGINMYYGFHVIESLASFEKATQFDNNFAMAYWGKALAYGPNINDLGYAASPDALAAMQKAKALYDNCTPVEKGLIDAMQVRYTTDTLQSRELLDQYYADAMKAVYQKFPESEDAAVLYTDALMVQHPWDFYDHDGKAKSWTPEIVNTLEAILKINPKHPGAAHYYIHAIEASDHPEKGIAVAKELPSLMPGVAHLVHMPSHIYIRAGYYNEGVLVNEVAVKSYNNYVGKYAPAVNGSFLYLVHNLHMQAACANMDGRFADALKVSNDCSNSFDSSVLDIGGYFGAYAQYVYMTPIFTMIRFGKWDDILKARAIPERQVYANLIWHYARGLAFARKQETDRAVSELSLMRKMMNDPQMLEHPVAFNPAIAGAGVAEKILEGIIAEEDGDLDRAIELLTLAMTKEDDMLYNEPKDWLHPVKQYLGATFTKARKYRDAEKVFRKDLQQNPNNGWSLTGLATVMLLQSRTKESILLQQEAKKAFERADVKITAAVY